MSKTEEKNEGLLPYERLGELANILESLDEEKYNKWAASQLDEHWWQSQVPDFDEQWLKDECKSLEEIIQKAQTRKAKMMKIIEKFPNGDVFFEQKNLHFLQMLSLLMMNESLLPNCVSVLITRVTDLERSNQALKQVLAEHQNDDNKNNT